MQYFVPQHKYIAALIMLFFTSICHAEPLQQVCAGVVPLGWIKVNDSWGSSSCGSPPSTVRNVWTIVRYSDKPIGSMIEVCNGPVPDGWGIIDTKTSLSTCMSPTQPKNIMTIKRFN